MQITEFPEDRGRYAFYYEDIIFSNGIMTHLLQFKYGNGREFDYFGDILDF